jgi:hypothetical protein
MEVWVLIVWLGSYRHGAVVTQEFNTKATCEAAKTLVIEIDSHRTDYEENRWALCVKK